MKRTVLYLLSEILWLFFYAHLSYFVTLTDAYKLDSTLSNIAKSLYFIKLWIKCGDGDEICLLFGFSNINSSVKFFENIRFSIIYGLI